MIRPHHARSSITAAAGAALAMPLWIARAPLVVKPVVFVDRN